MATSWRSEQVDTSTNWRRDTNPLRLSSRGRALPGGASSVSGGGGVLCSWRLLHDCRVVETQPANGVRGFPSRAAARFPITRQKFDNCSARRNEEREADFPGRFPAGLRRSTAALSDRGGIRPCCLGRGLGGLEPGPRGRDRGRAVCVETYI